MFYLRQSLIKLNRNRMLFKRSRFCFSELSNTTKDLKESLREEVKAEEEAAQEDTLENEKFLVENNWKLQCDLESTEMQLK